jgi:hypothetical protein
VILEDDELNISSVEAAVMSVPADAINKSTVALKKPTDHLNPEAWFDIESGRYALEDRLLPAVEEDGLALVAIAQDQQILPEAAKDMINQHNNGCTMLKWSLCNQQHHEIRIQGIANYYVIVYVTEAKNDTDVGVSMCI